MRTAVDEPVMIELNPREQRLYDRLRMRVAKIPEPGQGSGMSDILLLLPDFTVLLTRLRQGYAAVIGRITDKQHGWWRNAGSRAHQYFAERIIGKPRGLYLSSFRALSRSAVERLVRYKGAHPHISALLLKSVPPAAIVRRGQVTSVFVAEGDVARLRMVVLGRAWHEGIEVVTGLAEGSVSWPRPPAVSPMVRHCRDERRAASMNSRTLTAARAGVPAAVPWGADGTVMLSPGMVSAQPLCCGLC